MAAFKNMLGKKAIGTIGYIIYEVAEKPVVFITYININLKMQIEKKNGEMIPYECEPLPTDLPPGKEKMSVVYLPGSALNAYMMLVQTHLNTVLTKVKHSVPTSDQLKEILPKVNLPAGEKPK
ncbi:hypothetical protein F3A86_24290, partial [Salmonella enterica subsp. enterica serovar Typhi]|nr:hypothetical protein [Salmonella enterica subsp. enterica serovar Typhi]